MRERTRSIYTRCITCATHAPRAGAIFRRRRRMRGAAPDASPTLLDPTRPLLLSKATQGARWTECTARAPRSPGRSRVPLPASVRCARAALCITSEALPRCGCSRPLAPHAHAGQSHCKIDGQSCGAHAGGASTCWVLLVAVRDMRTVYRGATPTEGRSQRHAKPRGPVGMPCHLLGFSIIYSVGKISSQTFRIV